MKVVVIVLGMLLLPAAVHADIIEWCGADGVCHFTNLKEDVPPEERGSAQVVIDELKRRPSSTESAEPAPQGAEGSDQGQREATVVYDPSTVARAYLEGLAQGMEMSRAAAAGGGSGGGVQLNGPLAVANSTNTSPYSYFPYYFPFVTTSFDGGRSRHLTLRLLLQDQFAIDRDAPFVFEERLFPPFGFPPLGPDLSPFLARGLPHGFPQNLRVINY